MKIPEYDFFDTIKFENQFANRVDEVQNKFGKLPFLPIGNPYVDTGIITVAIYHEIGITSVTLGHALDAFLNINNQNSMGKEFVRRNKRVKSVTMMYSLANPLTNPAYGKSKYKIPEYVYPSKAEPSPLQERLFRTFLIEFLYAYGLDQDQNDPIHQCTTCGSYVSMDFNDLETTIDTLIKQDPSTKKDYGSGVHRGWFPLIGTIGSSAQALPGHAEFHIICGKCLFLVNFIPQVADLANGKLALYQSNNYELVRKILERNFEEFNNMDSTVAHAEKLEVIGSDDKTYHIIGILNTISNLERDLAHSNLIIWMFNNIGLGPDLEYLELPEETLVTLYDMTHLTNGLNIIRDLISMEENLNIYGERRFLDCIRQNLDYPGFYRKTDIEIDGVIPQIFYDYYQIAVRHFRIEEILIIQQIALEARKSGDEDRIERILKERNYSEMRSLLQPIMLRLIDQGQLDIHKLVILFSSENQHIPRRNPWKLFRYYLHPKLSLSLYEDLFENIEQFHDPLIIPDQLHRIKYLAQMTRNRMDHSQERFLSLIDRYSTYDIRQEFLRASQYVEGLTWDFWEKLENNFRRRDLELFFRMYCRNDQEIEAMNISENVDLINESGLHSEVAESIIKYIDIRIVETSESRAFTEVPYDLRSKRYSQFDLYNTINTKLQDNNRDRISEFAWFAYEKDASGGSNYYWSTMRDKIRVLFYQYRFQHLKSKKLEEQIKE